jgi:hypothetical protein
MGIYARVEPMVEFFNPLMRCMPPRKNKGASNQPRLGIELSIIPEVHE